MSIRASSRRPAPPGFTLIEALVAVAIMGFFLAVGIPSVINVMAVRNLENKTREVQTYLQMTKLQAVNSKILHRVRFYHPDGEAYWAYEMERIQPDGTWVRVGRPRKTIPAPFNVTFTLPLVNSDPVAVFSPVGAMANFAPNQNTIVLQSPKLDRPGQDDERVLSLFMGGSIQYAKRKSS